MSEIHEFLNYYSEVAENLEFMSNCMKRTFEQMENNLLDAQENSATMKEFKEASEFNCTRYYKAKDLLQEVVTGANGMCGLVDVTLLAKIQEVLERDAR